MGGTHWITITPGFKVADGSRYNDIHVVTPHQRYTYTCPSPSRCWHTSRLILSRLSWHVDFTPPSTMTFQKLSQECKSHTRDKTSSQNIRAPSHLMVQHGQFPTPVLWYGIKQHAIKLLSDYISEDLKFQTFKRSMPLDPLQGSGITLAQRSTMKPPDQNTAVSEIQFCPFQMSHFHATLEVISEWHMNKCF